jgi:hypothetical protein
MRPVISLLATALSIMGGGTTFFESSHPVTALHAMHELNTVQTLKQDFTFGNILLPHIARRLHQLQLLDAATKAFEDDGWGVLEVKGH